MIHCEGQKVFSCFSLKSPTQCVWLIVSVPETFVGCVKQKERDGNEPEPTIKASVELNSKLQHTLKRLSSSRGTVKWFVDGTLTEGSHKRKGSVLP